MRNIAPQAHALQSSFSKWSHGKDEANNALYGNCQDGYAFCTCAGSEEWWIADLYKTYAINSVSFHPRLYYENYLSVDEITVSTSLDLTNWTSKIKLTDNGPFKPLTLDLNNIHARFIKFTVHNKHFFCRQIEIFVDELLIPFRNVNLIRSPIISPPILSALDRGVYEVQELNLILPVIQEDDSILELGASIGAISSVIKSFYPNIKYCAVEANVELIDVMKSNHALNNIKGCTVINAAVGKPGIQKFYVSPNCWGSSLSPIQNILRIDLIESKEIKYFLEQYNPNFIICDIEGGEFDIFDESLDISTIDVICIEMHNKNLKKLVELHNYFINRGFKANASEPKTPGQHVRLYMKNRF